MNEQAETSEKLYKLPDEVEFPEDLQNKIYYDTARHLLIYKGIMLEYEKDVLLRLSEDVTYKKAIEVLFQRSQAINQLSGVIRFEVNGKWSVSDLIMWLSTVDLVYSRLRAFLLISSEFDNKIHDISYEERHTLTISPFEDFRIDHKEKYSQAFSVIISAALRKTYPLELKSFDFKSPGYIELIGSLNPLKVLADFITAWRHENTVREVNRKKDDTERMRIKADFMKMLVDRADTLTKGGATKFMEMFIKYTMDESLDRVKEMARDIRIPSVTVEQQ